MLRLIYDMDNHGQDCDLCWAKIIFNNIVSCAKSFRAQCLADEHQAKAVTGLLLGIKISYMLDKLGVNLREKRKIDDYFYVGRYQHQIVAKSSGTTSVVDPSTVSKKTKPLAA